MTIAHILQKDHGSSAAGCRAAALWVESFRFGASEGGRLQLLAGADAIAYQMRWQPGSAVLPLNGACGWTHIAAYGSNLLRPAAVQRPRPASPPGLLPPALVESWPWVLGGLVLTAIGVAVFGASLARRRTGADLGAGEAQIRLPEAGADPGVLEGLLQERAALRAQMRAVGIDPGPAGQSLNGAASTA